MINCSFLKLCAVNLESLAGATSLVRTEWSLEAE